MKRKQFSIGDQVVAFFPNIGAYPGVVDFIHLNGTLFIRSDDPEQFGKFAHVMQTYYKYELEGFPDQIGHFYP